MKKIFLALSTAALLTACNSGYQQDGPDQVNAAKKPAAADATSVNATADTTPMNADSAADSKMTAVSRQPQVDTSMTHLGTAPTGSPGGAGAKLIAASDCAGCHREKEKLLGPAYTAVAAKYPATPANIAMLSQHIIKGGAGHWGDIAMTPHPSLSETDTKEMVKYILALK